MRLRLRLGAADVDLARRRVHRGGRVQALTANEIAVLNLLADRAGEIVTREELLTGALGYASATSSRAIDACIARLRVKIERNARSPAHLVTVYGLGYRLDGVEETRDAGAHAEPSAWLAREFIADGLPQHGTPFVGRADLLARWRALLDAHSLVFVVGPRGSGSSRLVMEGLRASPERAPFRYLDLRQQAHSEPPWAALARVLSGQGGLHANGPAGVALAITPARPTGVLLLDHADAHLPFVLALVPLLQRLAPDLKLVVTGTARPDEPIGVTLRVPPLSMAEGRALFLQRAAAVGQHQHSPEDLRDIDALVAQVDGNPALIEYLASRSYVASPRELARRLGAAPPRESGATETDIDRVHRWVWSLLDAGDRRTLHALMVFRSAFTVDDAEVVLSAWPGVDPIDQLQRLLDRSLVRRVGVAPHRFEVLPLARLRGAVPPADPEEPWLAEGRARWAAQLDARVARALQAPLTEAALDALRAALPDVEARLEGALAQGDALAAGRAGLFVARLLERTGPVAALLEVADRALLGVSVGPEAEQIRLLRMVARYSSGDYGGAIEDGASVSASACVDAPWRLQAEAHMGVVRWVVDRACIDPHRARAWQARAKAEARSWWRGRLLNAVGEVWMVAGEPRWAAQAFEEASSAHASAGELSFAGPALERAARAWVEALDARGARDALRRLDALGGPGRPWRSGPAGELSRGVTLRELGDLDEAEHVLAHTQQRIHGAGFPTQAFDTELGWLWVEAGRWGDGRALLERARERYQSFGHHLNVAFIDAMLLAGAALAGEPTAARVAALMAAEVPVFPPLAVHLVALLEPGLPPPPALRSPLMEPLTELLEAALAGRSLPDLALPSSSYRAFRRVCLVIQPPSPRSPS